MAARAIRKLTALAVSRAGPGTHGDGGGLWLRVGPGGARAWVYQFMLAGKRHEMGLGSAHVVRLAKARELAAEYRERRALGIDPIEHRRAQRRAAQLEAARAITFKTAATEFIAGKRVEWSNPKHAAQWTATLERYVYPTLGDLAVASIDTALVLRCIEPIWTEKPETAKRVRGRIETILAAATVRGYREGENPARWRGHLGQILAARTRARGVEHHAALPFAEIGAFVAKLREQPGTAARALEFAILTAGRTSEVLGATWGELDFAARVWTLPAERMKGAREHRVPLSPRALEILAELRPRAVKSGAFVFPGAVAGRPLSNMAMTAVLRRMKRGDITVHGMRSTFRDWVSERTNYPGEVAEAALAHVVESKTEAAYRRGDLFAKRARLMSAWSEFCATAPAPAATVTSIRTK